MDLPEHLGLSDALRRHTVEAFGDHGTAWLEALPALLAEYARAWHLTLAPPFELSYNYVAPAMRADGSEAVLKAGIWLEDLPHEIAALRHFDGQGAVRLLEADAARGVFLLERVRPGTPLVDAADGADATTIAADVMRQLWRPLPQAHRFPTVTDWARAFAETRSRFATGLPFPERLLAAAEEHFRDLVASQATPILLHGDLHHWNILRSRRDGWLAIDPHGVIGEPAYETGAFLRNPMCGEKAFDHADLRRTQPRRVDMLAELLEFDRRRIVRWGIAQAVLSACWTLEHSDTGWQPAIAVAEALDELDHGM